jgi:ABC-2 type transport system ATP-binding protein
VRRRSNHALLQSLFRIDREDLPVLRRLAPALLALLVLAPAASAARVTVKTLHFDTVVGPQNDKHCDIVGDLYRPSTATRRHPAPAILTTNGFGGSKDDQATAAKAYAARGYVVLSYSGLGFGGSACKITLDDRDYDGKAGSQLVTFLGGGKRAKDGTRVDYVKRDRRGHDGRRHSFDPRLGMIGGSYGGQIQFSVAGIDPRLDAIIPIITWNDLSYSLAPNNTDFAHGVTYRTPGTEKQEWVSLFFGLGIVDGLQGAGADPSRNINCPNFDDRACTSKAQMDALGYPDDTTAGLARHASVESFVNRIRIPTLLAQGQADTLFNLDESVATYRSLRAQRTPVKLLWQYWGHSDGAAKPGEFNEGRPEASYEGRVFLQWFNYYLKRKGPKPSLDFTYFRDWVHYRGSAGHAYGRAPRYPVGGTRKLYLSGTGDLTSTPSQVVAGQANFVAPTAPASYSETSAVEPGNPPSDGAGSFAGYTTAPLAHDLVSVGIPTARLRLSAPSIAFSQATNPAGKLVLFLKLYDVAPDDSLELVHRLISAVRVADVTKPFRVDLPGVVHRYSKGHRIRFVIAGSDAAYKGNTASAAVSVLTDPANPGVVNLPVLHGRIATPAVPLVVHRRRHHG